MMAITECPLCQGPARRNEFGAIETTVGRSRLRIVPEPTRPVVIEDHGGYVVTADLEDEPPQHNHFDYRDAPSEEGECPRCDWDGERAEG